MFCVREKKKKIEKVPIFIIEYDNMKMVNLQNKVYKISEISLSSIKTMTDLYKAMEEYEKKYES
ncbi:MAG: hypothetical protein ACFFC3_10280 [Candidatus Odinarchaeota archaeon]